MAVGLGADSFSNILMTSEHPFLESSPFLICVEWCAIPAAYLHSIGPTVREGCVRDP